jgi:hypothetical protein
MAVIFELLMQSQIVFTRLTSRASTETELGLYFGCHGTPSWGGLVSRKKMESSLNPIASVGVLSSVFSEI